MNFIKEIIKAWAEKRFCKHDWEVHCKMPSYSTENDKTPHSIHETLICKNCGKIIKISL